MRRTATGGHPAIVATLILCNALNVLSFINVSATIWKPGGRLVIVIGREINRCLLSTDRSTSVLSVSTGRRCRFSSRDRSVCRCLRSKQSVRTLIDPTGQYTELIYRLSHKQAAPVGVKSPRVVNIHDLAPSWVAGFTVNRPYLNRRILIFGIQREDWCFMKTFMVCFFRVLRRIT